MKKKFDSDSKDDGIENVSENTPSGLSNYSGPSRLSRPSGPSGLSAKPSAKPSVPPGPSVRSDVVDVESSPELDDNVGREKDSSAGNSAYNAGRSVLNVFS